ncbi:YppG family protein [Amphibacillus jilinensis]|uniref:YppG family protein n=1 Tax=Amphibacillus jilinensis TaxID=1216008 RepID=UPI0003795868|nr:YppG family protein [Amphibacillus jilinensis]
MRSRRSEYPPNYRVPYYNYPQPVQPKGLPPQLPGNQQSFPPFLNTPYYAHNNWPIPQQGTAMGQQPQSNKGVMGYFQNNEGQLDFDKVLNTAGQVANTYQQFTPIVKGIGSFFKGVR